MLKKAFLTNSSGILCSRVFGFLRDLSMANILGAGVYSDIFFVAFKFPNLFRRIFGEGAFTQSFLPSFIASSKKGAFSVLVLLLFSCALIGFSLLVVVFSGAFTKVLALGFDDELIKLASPIVAIHFWYLFLVFLVTFFSTLLQYKQHFWVSAYNTALLNIAMICALLFARGSDELQIVYIASYGVLVGGVAQIALHIYPLYKLGFMRLFVCGVRELRVAGVTRVLFGKKLDSSGRDSVLGEQCGSVALCGKGTTAKVANLPQNKRSEVSLENPQSSHSPTATPRILMEESQKQSEKARILADNQTALGSSSRAAQSGVAIHNQNADSSNAQSVFSQNAVRRQDFGDKNGALQGDSRAHTWAYVTAESPQQSPFLAKKPTPKSQLPLFALLFLFALFATMVKIANFALILAVAISFVLVYKSQILSKKFLLGLLGLGALSAILVLPWVLKGLATSGMIAYPASIGYITSLPWAVSEEMRQNEVCWIMSWARAPLKNCREVLADSAWMVEWFSMKTRYFSYFKYFVYSFFIGLGFVLASRLYTRRCVSGFGVVLVCIAIGVLYWFFAGPDPRFGMVYVIPLLAVLFAYVLLQAYKARSWWLAFGFVLACAPMFMNGRQMFVIVWGVLLVACMWQRPRWLVGTFVLFSLISVPNLYRHDKWGILEYPKVREVYVQERVSDLGVLEYVRFDTPNDNTQAILYEARPMTPYFNQNLGKGEFWGREMFYTQEPKP